MVLTLLSFISAVAADDNIIVKGVVTDEKGDPVGGATILVNGSDRRGATGSDGTFTMSVPEYGKILVTCIGFENKEERIVGRKNIKIVLTPSNTLLPEVTVTSMLNSSMKFVFAPSELEVVKNQLLLKTRYKVPEKKFRKDSRLIIQPYLVNYTKGKHTAFEPVVFDGKNYDILVKRGHVCGDVEDKERYSRYAKVVDALDLNQMINYMDSCQVDDINDRYATEVYIKISTFCDDEYRDTVTIAQGVVYPMRFFDFDAASYDLDDSYAPRQKALNFNEKGEMHLRFRPSEYKIYEGDGRNWRELNKFRKILKDIEVDATKTLTSFSIMGYTSPEGSLKMNEKLSRQRVKSAIDAIFKDLSRDAMAQADIKYDGVVVPWDSVHAVLVRDGKTEEASELGLLLRRSRGNHDEISWAARRLKCYPLIRDHYLPRFRRVEYNYEYTEFRTLNFKEISELYKNDPANLTASEFWKYIRENQDQTPATQERLMREALKHHPDLLIAANNLAALLNRNHRADTTVLAPFLTEDCPLEVKINQTVALLQARDFDRANNLADLLPLTEKTEMLKAINDAMNGDYAKAYQVIGRTDCFNKAVLLLCMYENQEAWECLSRLEDKSAEVEYVRAIAANRLNNVTEAMIHLQQAVALKPELEKTAEIDGDVLDLMDFIK